MDLISDILDFPWVLVEYQNWLKSRPDPDGDYLFTQSRIRFEPRNLDQLVLVESVKVVNGSHLQIFENTPLIPIPEEHRAHVDSVLSELATRPFAVELQSKSDAPATCDWLLSVGFGQFIFTPQSVQDLDSRVSSGEIVRFPASPYEIDRDYWINICDLDFQGSTSSVPDFIHWLRTLHVQLLLGKGLDTFYCPSSPIAKKGVHPGSLYERGVQTITTSSGEFIVEGLRTNASTLGGDLYHQLLRKSLELKPMEYKQVFQDQGVNWGRLVKSRSRTDKQDSDWFLPPRPMINDHWYLLWQSWLEATLSTDSIECVTQLAYFHWYFVHLHPFGCANQSLAFAMVNSILNRVLGSGIPHLILDHLAMRFDSTDYVKLFKRAVTSWTTTESKSLARHQERSQKRLELDKFIASLHEAMNLDSRGAQLALLTA